MIEVARAYALFFSQIGKRLGFGWREIWVGVGLFCFGGASRFLCEKGKLTRFSSAFGARRRGRAIGRQQGSLGSIGFRWGR
jgi:hypothetical protein